MTVEAEVDGFIEKFADDMRELIRTCRKAMQDAFPDAVELVYDNYNFFVIGYGPSQRASESVFSLAASRTGVSLCFLQRGPDLPDPQRLLRGRGKVVRSLKLESASDLTRPEVTALMDAAVRLAGRPVEAPDGHSVVVKSVSAKQRPRR